MPKMLLGALAAAIAMFITGFVFFGTPLNLIAYSSTGTAEQAAIQQALATNLPQTGTYSIPAASDAVTTNLYSKGPIATIHYNTSGFGVMESGTLIAGFIHELIVALILGFALLGIAGRVTDFASRARLVVLVSVAGGVMMHLGEPLWYHHDWIHFIYLFLGDVAMMIAGGLVIARWFLPNPLAKSAV